MAMGRGWVEIANEALAYLGKDPIQSLQEEGGTAMMCRSLLPGAAESVLTERPWKEAAKDILLAPIADGMEQDEEGGMRIYTFQLPPDCVRLIEVHALGWRRTGDKIRSPRAPLAVRYVSMPEQPAVLGRMLREAIACLLASRLAVPLAGDYSAMANMNALYQSALTRASVQEAQAEHDIMPRYPDLYGSYKALASGVDPFTHMMDMRTYIQPPVHADDAEDADGEV